MTLVLLIAAVIAVVGGGGAAAVVAIKRNAARRNEVVPGVTSRAPGGWAGAHSPEAKLHRRLRDAVAAVRADARLVDSRAAFEQHALAVDDRLVAVAALPPSTRAAPLARVTEEVEAVEAAVAQLAAATVALGPGADLEAAMADMHDRLTALREAHAELDRSTGSTGTA